MDDHTERYPVAEPLRTKPPFGHDHKTPIHITAHDNRHKDLLPFVYTTLGLCVLNIIIWLIFARKPDYTTALRIVDVAFILSNAIFILWDYLKRSIVREVFVSITIMTLIFALISSFSYIKHYHDRNIVRQNIITQAQSSINDDSTVSNVANVNQSVITNELKASEAKELKELPKNNSPLPVISLYLIVAAMAYYLNKPEFLEYENLES